MSEGASSTAGRARPPHRPFAIRCRNCGAGIELKDDSARLTVCAHCGATLALTEGEQAVLSLGRRARVPYRIALGARLTIEGAPYEVVARVCFIEPGEPDEATHQYVLYHPRRRPLFLEDYRGEWSLAWKTRVRPTASFLDGGAQSVTTHDGQRWTFEEQLTLQVADVEGSLPYVLKVGDRIRRAEATAGSTFYEMELTEGELEYGTGRLVSPLELAAFTGDRSFASAGARRASGAGNVRANALGPAVVVGVFSVLVIVALVGLAFYCDTSGQHVLRHEASSEALAAGALTEPFTVPHDDTLVRVELDAPLSNAWMAAQLALVEEDGDTVVHVDEADLEYYSGYEGGESWSEGSRDTSVYFLVPEAGRYRLLLGGVSGYNEEFSSAVSNHPLTAQVFVDPLDPNGPYTMILFVVLLGLAAAAAAFFLGAMFSTRVGRGVAMAGGLAVAGCGVTGGVLASTRSLADEIEHPEGMSIRQSSIATGRPFFAAYEDPRAHLGGGVHVGK